MTILIIIIYSNTYNKQGTVKDIIVESDIFLSLDSFMTSLPNVPNYVIA